MTFERLCSQHSAGASLQQRVAPAFRFASCRHLACTPPRKGVKSPQAHARWREHAGEGNHGEISFGKFKTCPWVQRAAIVLREKNIAFEFRHIEPDESSHWFLAISPHKKVPVLRIDEKVSLFEFERDRRIPRTPKQSRRGCIRMMQFCARRSTALGPTTCRPSPSQ